VKLFDKYSLYWKSMLPFCVERCGNDPILVHAGSPCGQQLAAWEAELNGQARALTPCVLIVAWRRSGFSMKIPTIMATVTCSC